MYDLALNIEHSGNSCDWDISQSCVIFNNT